MARTYAESIALLRRWSNRDIEVLSNDIIADCLRYAADKAYRQLRIPPLEHTVTYTEEALMAATSNSNNRFSSVTELAIPADLTEFIQIREIDDFGRTTRLFNEKTDVRTFNDLYAEKYNDFAFWTRQGNCILLAPGFGNVGQNFGSTGTGNSTSLELYYYRRLPALHARYNITAANANLRLNTMVDADNPLPTEVPGLLRLSTNTTSNQNALEVVPVGMLNRTGTTFSDPAAGTTGSIQMFGNPVPNWLRDENERVILMGGLAEVFFYLQENEEAQKYAALFTQEMAELNKEEMMLRSSGGNVQVNFNGRGLI